MIVYSFHACRFGFRVLHLLRSNAGFNSRLISDQLLLVGLRVETCVVTLILLVGFHVLRVGGARGRGYEGVEGHGVGGRGVMETGGGRRGGNVFPRPSGGGGGGDPALAGRRSGARCFLAFLSPLVFLSLLVLLAPLVVLAMLVLLTTLVVLAMQGELALASVVCSRAGPVACVPTCTICRRVLSTSTICSYCVAR
jgi:hypothetical protein